MKNKLIKVIKNPLWIIVFLNNRGFYLFNDIIYLKIEYYCTFHKKLNLDNPQTFNEKLQWLKLNDRKEKYSVMVDKYAVKEYVSNIIGKEYIIPTLGIYNSFDDIDFTKLPNKFVMKCTHDSGGIVICKNKKEFNINNAKKFFCKTLKKNFYYAAREWPYKYVNPKILIEEYMEDNDTKELRDYKFFCFNGKAKFMFVATDRSIHETKFNFYDLNFKLMPFTQHYPNDNRPIKKPVNFNKMIFLAEKLSKNIPHVRVDFYEVNGQIYFGEFTFYHFAGFMPFEPEMWDKKIGDMIDLSLVEKNEK